MREKRSLLNKAEASFGVSNPTEMKNTANVISLLLLTCLMTSCYVVPHSRKMYSGPHKRDSELVVVNPVGGTGICEVDGKNIDSWGGFAHIGTEKLKLLPGQHSLAVGFVGQNTTSRENLTLSFFGEAGHVYQVGTPEVSPAYSIPGGRMVYGSYTATIRDVTHKKK